MNIDCIPEEMRGLKQWVNWKYEDRGTGKPTKIPVTIGGYGAKSTDPCDWYSLSDVVEFECDYSGIGFVFSKDDPYVGIDLDDCFVNGEVQGWAQPIIERLSNTYSEISPSGNGLKFFLRGSLPFEKGKKVQVENGAIEAYDHSRYFTVTAESYGPSVIAEHQATIDWLYETYFKPQEVVQTTPMLSVTSDDWNLIPVPERISRASKYLAKADPAIQGSGASDITYRLACTLARGFALPEGEVFNLLKYEYNPRCLGRDGSPSPWTDAELWRKANQGMSAGDPMGGLLKSTTSLQVGYGPEINGICNPPSRIVDEYDDDAEYVSDEDFFKSCIPETGLIRDIFDYYWETQNFRTNAMGLCIGVSIMETILGRRVESHTGARTNDYNVVIAGTSSGKESCEKVTQLMIEAGVNASSQDDVKFIMPPDVQSGNGLLREISDKKACLWICDEFGKHLRQIIDKKSNNAHAQQIGTVMLKMYGKSGSIYYGAAHSSGAKNEVNQPHFCMLGMTTHSVFNSITADQIEDGLYGRLAFWPAPRPKFFKKNRPKPVPNEIAQQIGKWIDYTHGNLGWENPCPPQIQMTDEALERWDTHFEQINERQQEEPEFRAGIWGRVAIRTMKLAMCQRCARFMDDPSHVGINFQIELEDVNWAIRLSNYLARISCSLANESVEDTQAIEAQKLILNKMQGRSKINVRSIYRGTRKFTAGDIKNAAKVLDSKKIIRVEESQPNAGGPISIFLHSIDQQDTIT
jgi:hypothetical protein